MYVCVFIYPNSFYNVIIRNARYMSIVVFGVLSLISLRYTETFIMLFYFWVFHRIICLVIYLTSILIYLSIISSAIVFIETSQCSGNILIFHSKSWIWLMIVGVFKFSVSWELSSDRVLVDIDKNANSLCLSWSLEIIPAFK